MLIIETSLIVILLVIILVLYYSKYENTIEHNLVPPKLNNNPSWDVVMTEVTPLISFFNAKGGIKNPKYEVEIDKSKNFDSENKIILEIPENGKYVTDIKIGDENILDDNTLYYWRVRTLGIGNDKSEWETSRFYVDTHSDDEFMNLVRVKVENVEASAGYNAKNIIDYDDPGLTTFWQSPPPGKKENWLKFDLGKPCEITRLWILSNPTDRDNWLKDFILQSSVDGRVWDNITESEVRDNNTFRNIIDFKPVEARYFRLLIRDYIGYAAQINEVIFYCPGKPKMPMIPDEQYVLIIGNEHNGFTFTDLAKRVESLNFKTVTVPYYETSLEMLERLPKKPIAIILSGNNADYPNLPMFEHNGEFEIIRNTDIPLLGICAGHQFLAMSYGYSRARSMGWSDISAIEPKTKMTKINILKIDPIFEGVKDEFIGPEIHGWEVAEPFEEFEVIAKSDYVQAQKSNKRIIYGIQFHSEINEVYNEGSRVIENFLKLAKNNQK